MAHVAHPTGSVVARRGAEPREREEDWLVHAARFEPLHDHATARSLYFEERPVFFHDPGLQ